MRWLHDPRRLTKTAAITLWAVGFLWLLVGRGFTAFLRPSLWPLLMIGVVMAVLLLLPCLLVTPAPKEIPRPRRNALWMRMGVLFLPVLCLVLAPHSALNSYAFSKRSVLGTADSGLASAAARRVNTDAKIADGASMNVFKLTKDAPALRGRQITADGIVFHDESTPKGYFVLFRFVITCCAADASPVGVLVKEPGPESLPDDGWVHVAGTVNIEELAGKSRIVLESPQITSMHEPSEPYLYP